MFIKHHNAVGHNVLIQCGFVCVCVSKLAHTREATLTHATCTYYWHTKRLNDWRQTYGRTRYCGVYRNNRVHMFLWFSLSLYIRAERHAFAYVRLCVALNEPPLSCYAYCGEMPIRLPITRNAPQRGIALCMPMGAISSAYRTQKHTHVAVCVEQNQFRLAISITPTTRHTAQRTGDIPSISISNRTPF